MSELDNITIKNDNSNDSNGIAEQSGNAGADLSGSEDTPKRLQGIIDAQNSVIEAYEQQVNRLSEQVRTLLRNGAVTATSEDDSSQGQGQNALPLNPFITGFGHAPGEIDSIDVAELGREIGKK